MNLLHHKKAVLDLRNDDIARRMSSFLEDKVSEDSVQRYFSSGSGIPIEKLGAFLDALNLKVADKNAITVEPKEYDALKLFAVKGLGQ